MARALIVGCGCRGRMLGKRLAAAGWAVRGTSRGPGIEAIERTGVEAAYADPERPATLLELVGDVAVVHYLMGSAQSERERLEAIHGPRLESFLERLVDTPVRGFVYEARGSVDAALLEAGAAHVRVASERWRIPVEILTADPEDSESWCTEALSATGRVLNG